MNYSYNAYGAAAGAMVGGLVIFAVIAWLIGIACAVLIIIGMWKVFKKAGKGGWEAIIPFYNVYTLLDIAGINPLFMLILLASFIPFIGWIAVLGLNIFAGIYLAKSFGKEAGFGVGIGLLPVVFYPMLGFSKTSTYQSRWYSKSGVSGATIWTPTSNNGAQPSGATYTAQPEQPAEPAQPAQEATAQPAEPTTTDSTKE